MTYLTAIFTDFAEGIPYAIPESYLFMLHHDDLDAIFTALTECMYYTHRAH